MKGVVNEGTLRRWWRSAFLSIRLLAAVASESVVGQEPAAHGTRDATDLGLEPPPNTGQRMRVEKGPGGASAQVPTGQDVKLHN